VRPLSLKIKGLTSFRDEQEIDFTDMDLFVLWGPTGSGKSSVLDAITYALYGKVERVGNEPSQLVSQGQPRMAVALEFAVGDRAYRITRSTTRGGQTRVRLDRREGSDWVTHGEGADSVRGANKLVQQIVGLDYDAFTRSVILPQGKFADFLAGDERKRRDLLTELLGLELFKTMAQRANEIAKDARLGADKERELLEREYAGVTQASVATARREARNAAGLVERAHTFVRLLTELHRQYGRSGETRAGAMRCASDAAAIAKDFSSVAISLEDMARAARDGDRRAAEVKERLDAAQQALASAGAARAAAENEHGNLEHLAAVRVHVGRLEASRGELQEADATLRAERERQQIASRRLESCARAVRDAQKEQVAARKDLAAKQRQYEDAQAHDMVGTLVADLREGDPCPVCQRPLEILPESAPGALKIASNALEKAEAAARSADATVTTAEKEWARATEARAAIEESTARCDEQVRRKKEQVDELVALLAQSFPAGIPNEPELIVGAWVDDLRRLGDAELAAAARVEAARTEVDAIERDAERASASVGRLKTALLTAGVSPLKERIAEAAPGLDLPEILPADIPDPPGEMAAIAAIAAKELEAVARDLLGIADEHATLQQELLQKAVAAAPPNVSLEGAGIEDLIESAQRVVIELVARAAVADEAATTLATRLASRRELEAGIERQRAENALYSQLGRELRSDRIVDYLQSEALCVLAAAASNHLSDLSNGRYRLSYEQERFVVLDAWNGDERRNVKTLSGGETFLASLALAVALSEQVQMLAVTEHERLESLFLDEGFGTLDASTLDVVVAAIEQLGGDGRLVGIITHISELAERLPVKLQIQKSPRGSSIAASVGSL
jgi:DNA repair protein SbcC/Rad50